MQASTATRRTQARGHAGGRALVSAHASRSPPFLPASRPVNPIHEIHETIDFQRRGLLSSRGVPGVLRYGLDAAWAPPLCEAIVASLVTPHCCSGRSAEWRARARRSPGTASNSCSRLRPRRRPPRLNASALAAVLGQHARDAAERYAQRARFRTARGLSTRLHGFGRTSLGRYYLLDYKSTWANNHETRRRACTRP